MAGAPDIEYRRRRPQRHAFYPYWRYVYANPLSDGRGLDMWLLERFGRSPKP